MDVSAVAESRSSGDSDRDGLNDSSSTTKDGRTTSSALSNGVSRPSAETNKFQSAISAWRSKWCTFVSVEQKANLLIPRY